MYIGIDIGGMSIKAGLVDNSCKIIHKEVIPTGPRRPMEEITHDIGLLADTLIRNSKINPEEILSVGIGVPGASDTERGIILKCDNINLDNAPVAAEIHKYINKPVFLNNDANVAGLAEYYSLGKEMDCFIIVTLGTGVGGGIIIGGKIFSGFNGIGAEFGHMVINENERKCNCGRKGCWEPYASVTALIAQTKKAMELDKNSLMHKIANNNLNNVNGKTSFDAAKLGDNTALKVVDQYIHYIATGVANLINIFQPNIIAIGGAISKEGDYLLTPLKKYVYEEAYTTNYTEKPEIKIATLGNDAGIIGAAMLGKSNGVV